MFYNMKSLSDFYNHLIFNFSWCMKHCESSGTPFKKVKFSRIKNELQQWAADHNFQLDNYTENMRKRDKRVVAKTLHHAGIVVPYDKKTELGYRPLPESTSKRMWEFVSVVMKDSIK